MAMDMRLELKLSQKLILTPQLQQSIKLLQLPLLELSQDINQELMNNPLLEEGVEKEQDSSETSGTSQDEEKFLKPTEDTEAPLEKIFGFTTDNYFEERESDGRDFGYFGDSSEETISPFERNSVKADLYEHLLWQLRLSSIPESLGKTAEIIINNLTDDGYLQTSTIDEIAESSGVDMEMAEEALHFVQAFDPSGVGARNLQECLLLQLEPLKLKETLVEEILANGFNELEGKKYKQLANKLKVPIDDVLSAIKIIESLEPRPGRNFSSDEPIHIIPDVYVKESEGEFIITLNDEGIPKLRLSNYYRKLLANKKSLGPEEKLFLEEKLRAAIWLLRSLDQRNKTIYRVTESILKFQENFFRMGAKFLKPLNLRNVAEDLGMHESTISRVTSNKYIQCPQGLLNFRYFFSNAVPTANGDISSSTVKAMISKIISEEDTASPLNDQKVVGILKEKGITIARRTAAKYREELKILSHLKRKKWF